MSTKCLLHGKSDKGLSQHCDHVAYAETRMQSLDEDMMLDSCFTMHVNVDPKYKSTSRKESLSKY